MTIPFYGGCACGAIRYECTAEPLEMFCCHCRDCQQASGGPYSPAVLVPSTAFKLDTRLTEILYHAERSWWHAHARFLCGLWFPGSGSGQSRLVLHRHLCFEFG